MTCAHGNVENSGKKPLERKAALTPKGKSPFGRAVCTDGKRMVGKSPPK